MDARPGRVLALSQPAVWAGRAIRTIDDLTRYYAVRRQIAAWLRLEDLARRELDAAQSLDVWHREQAEVAPRLPRLLGPKTMRQRPLGVGNLDGGAVLFEPDSDNLHVCRRPVNHVDEGLRVDVAYFHGGVGAHLDALPALVQ